MRKAPHFLMYIYQGNSKELRRIQGNSREVKKTQGNSRELKRTQGNSKELKETQGNSRELKGALGNLDLFQGSARRSNGRKKTQEKGQRCEISQIRGEKRKHRSAL